MTDSDIDSKLAVFDEKLKTLDKNINLIIQGNSKADETLTEIREKLIARIQTIETENAVQKEQIGDLISYKKSSAADIKKLENLKSRYEGAIAAIMALVVSGFLFKVIGFL